MKTKMTRKKAIEAALVLIQEKKTKDAEFIRENWGSLFFEENAIFAIDQSGQSNKRNWLFVCQTE